MFQFTIRELLILTVAAGLGAGWWIDHRAMEEAKVQAVIEAIMHPPEPCGFSQDLADQARLRAQSQTTGR